MPHPPSVEKICEKLTTNSSFSKDNAVSAALRFERIYKRKRKKQPHWDYVRRRLTADNFLLEPVGELIEKRYLVLGVVSKGGQGEVSHAFDFRKSKDVAIKKSFFVNRDHRLLREYEIGVRLTKEGHPTLASCGNLVSLV